MDISIENFIPIEESAQSSLSKLGKVVDSLLSKVKDKIKDIFTKLKTVWVRLRNL